MKYESLPAEIRKRIAELAMERCGTTQKDVEQIFGDLHSKECINIGLGFIWPQSSEGYNFWHMLFVFERLDYLYNRTAEMFYFKEDKSSPINAGAAELTAMFGTQKSNAIIKERINASIDMVEHVSEFCVAPHYDEASGSLYQFARHQKLNVWEFDLVKRIVRCRKKGSFKKDLEKTKLLIDLYVEDYGN